MIAFIACCIAASAHLQDDPKAGKHIVWSDEFDKPGLPDPAKWSYEKGFVRNHEQQYYTEARKANARVNGDGLLIQANQEPFENAKVTSAALESKDAWDHGYIEVKGQFPTGKGTWPAIWFLGDSIRKKGADYVGWPACGEIDLMENVGFDPTKVHFNIHVPKNSTAEGSVASSHIDVPDAWTKSHVYGLDYGPHKLDIYFDGKKIMSYLDDGKGKDSWPFDKPQFIILNLAIGGDWGGQQGVDPAIFPSKFKVSYVRVYQ